MGIGSAVTSFYSRSKEVLPLSSIKKKHLCFSSIYNGLDGLFIITPASCFTNGIQSPLHPHSPNPIDHIIMIQDAHVKNEIVKFQEFLSRTGLFRLLFHHHTAFYEYFVKNQDSLPAFRLHIVPMYWERNLQAGDRHSFHFF